MISGLERRKIDPNVLPEMPIRGFGKTRLVWLLRADRRPFAMIGDGTEVFNSTSTAVTRHA